MRDYILNKLKQNKAFSLAETLIVVAILVVLMGISMPLIGKWQSKLDMAELDNHAKSIYLEAQHQLIAKRVEGALPHLQADMEANYSGNILSQAPHDFDEELNGQRWNELYHLGKQETAMAQVIPTVSHTYQMDGDYLIEFNPVTGEVYGVFYWEKNEPINYGSDVVGLLGRDSISRTPLKLGYYGGQLENTIETSVTLQQNVELINSEELYLKIAYNRSKLLTQYKDFLTINCTITDEHGGEYNCSLNGNNYEEETDSQIIYYILLDSMTHSFKEITGLHPGDNISVDVKGTFVKGDEYSSEAINTGITGNSLFASRSANRIEIGAVRHLRNLDESIYTHEANGESVDIILVNSIDFDGEDYAWIGESYDKANALRPITSLKPIQNDALFGADRTSAKTVVNGNSSGVTHKIQNLVIQGNVNTGIFGSVVRTDFVNIDIEDIKVTGTDNVGALAGSISEGMVSDCGVYLTTYVDEAGRRTYYWNTNAESDSYENAMIERYATRTVEGNQRVGGLFGKADNVTVDNSFAAIQVKGGGTCGGFIGQSNTVTIENAYSSGDVSGNGSVYGGFIGSATETNVSNAYSTSDLYVADIAGGFTGNISGGTYNKCYSYGQVLKEMNNSTQVPTNAGAFVASSTATHTDCRYLRQQGYNTKGLVENASGITPAKYGELVAAQKKGSSYPYDQALENGVFPFENVVDEHYGDWPLRYVIDTSLVYYERYADDTYGYYCETRLSSRDEEEDDTVDDYVWVLDSLQDRECVEDGYALLSLHSLSEFSYQLSVGSASVTKTAKLTTVNTQNGNSNEAVTLRQQTALKFNGYAQEYDSYAGKDILDSFSISGMYLYQLPYELQCTDRVGVDNFYDKFVVYAGYALGQDVNTSEPVIGGRTVDAIDEEGNLMAETFYYCPHFAKTAVNPGMNNDELKNPAKVYVRSARQLNALGRNSYYWNDKDGMSDRLYFVQESDINFSAYTEEYCGKEFRMLYEKKKDGTNNDVKNVPIGVPDSVFGNSAQQFKNSYDGQGYKIIDYGVAASYQFTGMFGEIYGAELKNIVMTVSDKKATGLETGDKKGYLAGKIISRYTGEILGWLTDKKAGTGALAGLAYMSGNTIENCTAAGYDVEHYTVSASGLSLFGGNSSQGIMAGGLIGSSFSSINNCSATNYITLSVDGGNYDKPVFIGGLVGSFGFGNLANSYSGGTIDILNQRRLTNNTVAVGGVCPGWLSLSSESLTATNVHHRNLYSYTTYKPNLLNNMSAIDYKIACMGDVVSGNTNVLTMHYENCYYLSSEVAGMGALSSEERGTGVTNQELKENNVMPKRVTSSPNNAGRPMDYTFPVSDELQGKAYPYPTVITNPISGNHLHYGDWPDNDVYYTRMPVYYEKYEDGEYGIYTVYNDGEIFNQLYTDNSKKIEETGYGVLQLTKDTNKTEGFTYTINKREYYFYEMDFKNNPNQYANGEEEFTYEYVKVTTDENGNKTETPNSVTTKIYVNKEFAAAISITQDLGYVVDNSLQVRTMDQFEQIAKVRQHDAEEIYLRQSYNLYPEADYQSISIPAKYYYDGGSGSGNAFVGAKISMFAANNGTIENCSVKDAAITESVIINASTEQDTLDYQVAAFVNDNLGIIRNSSVIDSEVEINVTVQNGIDSEKFSSLRLPSATGFVGNNKGTIEGSGVYSKTSNDNMKVIGNRSYGFVDTNSGTITQCFVAGTVTGKEYSSTGLGLSKAATAAGFAGKNTGTITLSYANSLVDAGNGGEAAGFVMSSSSNSDGLTKCYSAGDVTASTANGSGGSAFGFMKDGKVKECYSISKVDAEIMQGFAQSGTVADTCYWVCDAKWNYNATLNSAIGTEKTLWEIHSELDYAGYTGEDCPFDSKLAKAPHYLYPSVGMPHYGDWPAIRNAYAAEEFLNEGLNFNGIFYYEKYSDSSYGIYAVGQRHVSNENNKQITGMINTLAVEEGLASERGYGIFYKSANKWAISTNNNNYTALNTYATNNGSNLTEPMLVSLNSLGIPAEYYFYGITIIDEYTDTPANFTRNFRYTYATSAIFQNNSYAYSTATINLADMADKRRQITQ